MKDHSPKQPGERKLSPKVIKDAFDEIVAGKRAAGGGKAVRSKFQRSASN